MKEKPLPTQAKKSRREAAKPRGKPEEPARRETRKRIRKIVERHRETLDELAK